MIRKSVEERVMLERFVLSEEGLNFTEAYRTKFGGDFCFDMCADGLALELEGKSYEIPLTTEEFKSLINDSVSQNKNLLYDKIKNYKVIVEPGVIY